MDSADQGLRGFVAVNRNDLFLFRPGRAVAALGANLERFVEVVPNGDLRGHSVLGERNAGRDECDTGPNVGGAVEFEQLSPDEREAHELIDLAVNQRLHVRIAAVGHLIDVDEQVIKLLLGDEENELIAHGSRLVLAGRLVLPEDRLRLDDLGERQARVGAGRTVDVVDGDLLAVAQVNRFVSVLANVGGSGGGLNDSFVVGTLEGRGVRDHNRGARGSDVAQEFGVPFVLVVNFVVGAERELALRKRRVRRDGFTRASGDEAGLGLSDEVQELALALHGFLTNEAVNTAFVLLDEVLPVGVELVGVELVNGEISHDFEW